jgi:hypothetical protein
VSDQAAAGKSSASSGPVPAFDERWGTPLWWYPVAIAVASILAAEFRVAAHDLTVWIPFGVLLPGAAVIVWTMGRSRVQVVGGQLRVNEAHLPLPLMASVYPLDAATLRRLVGRHGDPAAFVSIRPWIGSGVQIVLDDPDDPCPYWIISSRRPAELAAALLSGR